MIKVMRGFKPFGGHHCRFVCAASVPVAKTVPRNISEWCCSFLTKVSGRQKILFYLVTLFYWFSMYAFASTLSPYAGSIGAPYWFIGIIVGSNGIFQLILRIPLGILSDRTGKRKIFIITGTLIAALCGLLFFLFKTPSAMFAIRLLSGIGAAMWVQFTVLFASYFEEAEVPRAISIMNGCSMVGITAGILTGGAAAQSFGLSAPFALAAVSALPGLLLCAFIQEKKTEKKPPEKLSGMFSVIKGRDFIITTVLGIIAQFIYCSTMYGFTPVAAKTIGANSFDLGLLSALSTLPGVFAAVFFTSVLTRRLGIRLILFVSFAGAAAMCFTLPLIKSLPVLFLNQMVMGFFLGGAFPMLMGLSMRGVTESKRSTAMGIFQAMFILGTIFGPIIVGAVIGGCGLGAGFSVAGFTGIVAAFLSLLYAHKAAKL